MTMALSVLVTIEMLNALNRYEHASYTIAMLSLIMYMYMYMYVCSSVVVHFSQGEAFCLVNKHFSPLPHPLCLL